MKTSSCFLKYLHEASQTPFDIICFICISWQVVWQIITIVYTQCGRFRYSILFWLYRSDINISPAAVYYWVSGHDKKVPAIPAADGGERWEGGGCHWGASDLIILEDLNVILWPPSILYYFLFSFWKSFIDYSRSGPSTLPMLIKSFFRISVLIVLLIIFTVSLFLYSLSSFSCPSRQRGRVSCNNNKKSF